MVKRKTCSQQDARDLSGFPTTDFMLCMINSFRELTREDAAANLRAACRYLLPSGRYLIGLHLTPECVISKSKRYTPRDERHTASRNGITVATHLRHVSHDFAHRQERLTLDATVRQKGQETQLFRECLTYTTYTLAQFRKLVRASGFTISAAFELEDFSSITPTDRTESCIFELERK